MASSVLWPGLTSAGSATPCDVGYSCGEFTPLVGSVSRRPPRVRTTTFVPCSCRIYCRELRVALDFLVSGRVIRSIQPPMRFLFVSSELCLRLLSDSTSRRTPLPLANGSCYRARSGLSPPSRCPCRAHQQKPLTFVNGFCNEAAPAGLMKE